MSGSLAPVQSVLSDLLLAVRTLAKGSPHEREILMLTDNGERRLQAVQWDSIDRLRGEVSSYEVCLRDMERQMQRRENRERNEADLYELSPVRSPSVAAKMEGQAVIRKVSARLTELEAQLQNQMVQMENEVDRKMQFYISNLQRGQPAGIEDHPSLTGPPTDPSKPPDASSMSGLKYDILQLKEHQVSSKSEIANLRRIIMACERDMEDFTNAMDAVNVDLDEVRSRVDTTHSIMSSRQRVEASLSAEMANLKIDVSELQDTVKTHDTCLEELGSGVRETKDKAEGLREEVSILRGETFSRLEGKVESQKFERELQRVEGDLIRTMEDFVGFKNTSEDKLRALQHSQSSAGREMQQKESKMEKIKEEILKTTDEAMNLINDRIDVTNSEVSGLQHGLKGAAHSIQGVCEGLEDAKKMIFMKMEAERNETLGRQQQNYELLKSQIRGSHESNEQQNEELTSAEENETLLKNPFRRLNTFDLLISGLQGGMGERRRDALKMREEIEILGEKQKELDRQGEKQESLFEKVQNGRRSDELRLQREVEGVHRVLDAKVGLPHFEVTQRALQGVAKGMAKLAQVVGVFSGSRFDEGTDEGNLLNAETEGGMEVLDWPSACESLSFRIDRCWRQRCGARFKNVMDVISKKADHSTLRLLQISQQHIESQLERVKHERELWKETLERRQTQHVTLAQLAAGQGLPTTPPIQTGPLSKRILRPGSAGGGCKGMGMETGDSDFM